jgi:hypothetical protein
VASSHSLLEIVAKTSKFNQSRIREDRMSESMQYVLVGLVVQAVACAAYSHKLASEKGHDASAWAIGGFLFSIIALIAAAGLPDRYLRNTDGENGDSGSEIPNLLAIPGEDR